MKKITLLLSLILISCFSFGQVTIVNQEIVGTSGIVSSVLADTGFGTYSADDFILGEAYIINTITVPGFGSGGSDVSVNMTGLNVYIYTDSAGVPSSDPSVSGAGVLEIINLSPTSTALTITDGEFTIDVEAALGTELELGAGTYWLVVAANVPNDGVRWNWYSSAPGGNAMLIDEGNFGGLPWTTLPGLGLTFDSLAFSIIGTSALSVSEFSLEKISVTPNPAQDYITINFPQSVSNFSTELYDIAGKLVLKSNNIERLNIGKLHSGVYILKVATDSGSVTKRIIKS